MAIASARYFCALGLIVLVLGFGHADAQTPQQTTATYGDWTVSCAVSPNAGGQKTCAVLQSQTIPGQSSPISRVVITRFKPNEPLRLSFQAATNVWVLTGVSFVTEQSEPLLVAPFKWCVPARCLADIDLTEAVINKMRLQKTAGRISYKNALQADVQIPLSFAGFSEAMDAFQKQ